MLYGVATVAAAAYLPIITMLWVASLTLLPLANHPEVTMSGAITC